MEAGRDALFEFVDLNSVPLEGDATGLPAFNGFVHEASLPPTAQRDSALAHSRSGEGGAPSKHMKASSTFDWEGERQGCLDLKMHRLRHHALDAVLYAG